MMTKAEIMRLVASGRAHECFTHSTEGTFDITLMRIAARSGFYQGFTSELTPELIENIKRTRDWERDRVLMITDRQMQEPTLWVAMATGEHLLIDGTHRLLARADCGLQDFRGYMAELHEIIRPDPKESWFNPDHDWGRIKIVDGHLYDRVTGERIQ